MKVIGWFYVALAALVFSLWPPTPSHAQPEDGCTSPVVTLFGEITQELATKVASSIIASDSEKCSEPMLMYINSPGGDIVAGSEIVDAMALSHRPVDTINVGEAASMAAIIYLKGHKRTAWPHAILMLHRSFHRMRGGGIGIRAVDSDSRRLRNGYCNAHGLEPGGLSPPCRCGIVDAS